jgi:F-type H+-transporting ATPase subunit b
VNVLSFDPGLTFWTLVTFGCLFLLLARFAFKPLGRILQQREDAIRESLEKAERAREEADRMAEENRQGINEAREEARRIISEGHKIVARMKHEAGESARNEANAIIQQANEEIRRETRRSLDELKSTVANLSVRIAAQVVRAELDEQRHAELADDFIERLKKSHAQRSS